MQTGGRKSSGNGTSLDKIEGKEEVLRLLKEAQDGLSSAASNSEAIETVKAHLKSIEQVVNVKSNPAIKNATSRTSQSLDRVSESSVDTYGSEKFATNRDAMHLEKLSADMKKLAMKIDEFRSGSLHSSGTYNTPNKVRQKAKRKSSPKRRTVTTDLTVSEATPDLKAPKETTVNTLSSKKELSYSMSMKKRHLKPHKRKRARRGSNPFMFSPKSQIRLFWDLVIIAPLLIYVTTMMPFRASSFDQLHPFFIFLIEHLPLCLSIRELQCKLVCR